MSQIKANGRIYDSYDKIDFIDIGCSKGVVINLLKKNLILLVVWLLI